MIQHDAPGTPSPKGPARPTGSGTRPDAIAGDLILTPVGRLDRFGTVLTLLAVTIVVLFVAEESFWALLVAVSLQGMVLVVALDASGARRSLILAGRVLAAASVILLVASEVSGLELPWVRALTTGLAVAVTVVAPLAIARRLARQPVIDLSTIAAALSIYLLIGLAFTNLYAAVDAVAPPLFSQADADPTYSDFLYFSFVTLATLGYGDLTPATNGSRMAAVVETVLGQIYLVTIVAVIVSNLGRVREPRHRRRHRSAPDGVEDRQDDAPAG